MAPSFSPTPCHLSVTRRRRSSPFHRARRSACAVPPALAKIRSTSAPGMFQPGTLLGFPALQSFAPCPHSPHPEGRCEMLPGRDTASTGNRPLPERRFAALPCGEPHPPFSPSRALSGPLGVAPLMAFVSPDGQIRTATSAGLHWASSIRSPPVSRRRFGLIHLQGLHLRASPVPPTGGIDSWRGPFLSWASLSPPVRASIAGEGTGPSGPRHCSPRRNSGKDSVEEGAGSGSGSFLVEGREREPGYLGP